VATTHDGPGADAREGRSEGERRSPGGHRSPRGPGGAAAPPEELTGAVAGVLGGLGLELYDLTLGGGRPRVLKVLVDRSGGIDLDGVTDATRALSSYLDRADPVTGSYTLEVSSPGLERPLRTPHHFEAAVGETVSIRYRDAEGRGRRVRGRLAAARPGGVTVEVAEGPGAGDPLDLPLDAITQARTVFEWGPAPRPSRPARGGRAAERTGSTR